MTCIYIATNPNNGKQYVGQTVDFNHRMRCHCHSNENNFFDNALQKYGRGGFDFVKIEYPENTLNYWEAYWIEMCGSMTPNGYNLKEGGSHGRFSEEVKKKISKALTGKKLSAETRKKMSESKRRENLSAETRRKLSDSHRRENLSSETRLKGSESKRGEKNPFFGKHHSPEIMERIAQKNTGRKKTPEELKKLSQAQIGKVVSLETRRKLSVAVQAYLVRKRQLQQVA